MSRSILFFTYYKCLPHRGGTERVTTLLAEALSEEYGYECHSAYLRDVDDECPISPFVSTRQISSKDIGGLAAFIDANHIDFIVVQGVNTLIPFFSRAIAAAAHPCSLIFAIHFVPGDFEKLYISFSNQYRLFRRYYSLKSLALMCAYPLGRTLYMKHMRASYRTTAKLSHSIVLLSDTYRKNWANLSGMAEADCKVKAIPNPCSFNVFLSPTEIDTKEKRVLIVSRLREKPKNISSALRIWKELMSDPGLADWQLDVVGDGADRQTYEKWVASHDVKNVNFYGRRDPLPFYKRSRIFMMTSLSEGWGLTLVEASQMGCVPIAYNSYASLSDIIDDGHNGVLIATNAEQEYAQALKSLMYDEEKWRNLASNAVENSHRFDISKISRYWHNLFSSVISK